MVEHADVDQSQGLAQPLGNANIRLAGLAYAGGVVVGHNRFNKLKRLIYRCLLNTERIYTLKDTRKLISNPVFSD